MELLIDRVPETRGQRKWLVALAKLHESASARNTVEAKRKAEGWEDTSLEWEVASRFFRVDRVRIYTRHPRLPVRLFLLSTAPLDPSGV